MDSIFDEAEACAYMRTATGTVYDDDQLLNIIDIIFDYYEDNGQLDLDSDADLDVADLIAHVSSMLCKDKGNAVAPADVAALVNAELAYEDQLFC